MDKFLLVIKVGTLFTVIHGVSLALVQLKALANYDDKDWTKDIEYLEELLTRVNTYYDELYKQTK